MTLKSSLYFLLLLVFFNLKAQDMNEGFKLLETGQYASAEVFFKEVLESYPSNKTARLCYGRAIGLNGKSGDAKTLFINLLNDYPNDFEVKLNFAESLLWNSDFTEAKAYYSKLIVEDDQSFAALLGFANTLSNLKEYEDALFYVNKALTVLPGNPNALVSKKYIYLGYAYQKQQGDQYKEAEALLKKNLELFENDTETLLNLANLYLIMKEIDNAKSTYELIGENPANKITSLNGLSLAAHLDFKEKDALSYSEQAESSVDSTTTAELKRQTRERYIQALIWNSKFKNAEELISKANTENPNENWVLALRATLNIYKSDFKKSLIDYDRILVNDSASFDGNLGKANTLKALKFYEEAYESANNTLKFYTNQKDALNFIKDLNTQFTPFWDSKVGHTFDNGKNYAYYFNNTLNFPMSSKFGLFTDLNYRTTENSVTKNSAISNDFSFGINYQFLPTIGVKGKVGVAKSDTQTNDYNQFITDITFNIKPYKLQILDVGFKREIQSFNADLLEEELIMNNIYANYNLSTNFKLGWFTQYFYTFQNDDNTRHLLFTSLYYNILAKPALKAGLNYQYITFKNQRPTVYFSPGKFNAGEVFVNIIKDEVITKPKEWYYDLTAAYGLQYIEEGAGLNTYRIQARLGYKFSDRCLSNLFFTRSNIASATAAGGNKSSGFTFTEIGIRFKWYLFSKPIYKLKS